MNISMLYQIKFVFIPVRIYHGIKLSAVTNDLWKIGFNRFTLHEIKIKNLAIRGTVNLLNILNDQSFTITEMNSIATLLLDK